jgi:hypothetical protein
MGKLTVGGCTRNISNIPSKKFPLSELLSNPSGEQLTLNNIWLDDIDSHVGADHIHYKAKNLTGSTINKGTIVSFSGTIEDNDIIRVKVYQPGEVAIGIAHENIAHGDTGLIVNTGRFDGFNTQAYDVFNILYPTTNGGLTTTKPTTGTYQACAIVIKRAGGEGGSLLVEFSEPKYVHGRTIGWKDLISPVAGGGLGGAAPTIANFGTATTGEIYRAYSFGIGDYVYMQPFHINHDILPGAEAYLHVHWSTNGTDTGLVRWELTVRRALGHNQGSFDTTEQVIYVEQAANATAWQHMVTETDTPLILVEPDELILVTLKRVAPTSGSNAATVFGLQVDLHYQSEIEVTPRKAPNFYVIGD